MRLDRRPSDEMETLVCVEGSVAPVVVHPRLTATVDDGGRVAPEKVKARSVRVSAQLDGNPVERLRVP